MHPVPLVLISSTVSNVGNFPPKALCIFDNLVFESESLTGAFSKTVATRVSCVWVLLVESLDSSEFFNQTGQSENNFPHFCFQS